MKAMFTLAGDMSPFIRNGISSLSVREVKGRLFLIQIMQKNGLGEFFSFLKSARLRRLHL